MTTNQMLNILKSHYGNQTNFARQLGIGQSQLSKLLAGKHAIRPALENRVKELYDTLIGSNVMAPIREIELDCSTYAHLLDEQHVEHTEPQGITEEYDNAVMYEYVSPQDEQPVYVIETSAVYAGDGYVSRAFLFRSPFTRALADDFLLRYAAKRRNEEAIYKEIESLRRADPDTWGYNGLYGVTQGQYQEAVRRLRDGQWVQVSQLQAGDRVQYWTHGLCRIESRTDRTSGSGQAFVQLTFGGQAPDVTLPAEAEMLVFRRSVMYYLDIAWYASEYYQQGLRHLDRGTQGIAQLDYGVSDLSDNGGWTAQHAQQLRFARANFQNALAELEKTRDLEPDGLWTKIDGVRARLREVDELLPAAERAEKKTADEGWKEFAGIFENND